MNHHYLVIDLEATCWEKGTPQEAPNEIIEIGLALLSPSKELLHHEGWFVRPKIAPRLSDFCTRLTSITQADVENAPALPEALEAVEQRVKEVTRRGLEEALFVSWGDYDRKQFVKDCKLHGCSYPFGAHLNLKRMFQKKFNLRNAGLASSLSQLGLEFQGTHHRGVDDALNSARILQTMPEL